MAKTWIVLLRGINVGGSTLLTMASLTAILADLGATDIRTYIQSGNVIFQSTETRASALSGAIADSISQHHGLRPRVLALTLSQFERAVSANPFPRAATCPSSLHLYFLTSRAHAPDLEAMNKVKSISEQFVLKDRLLYFYAPDGIGRSKLAARIERLVGVEVTGRNWRSVSNILALARRDDPA